MLTHGTPLRDTRLLYRFCTGERALSRQRSRLFDNWEFLSITRTCSHFARVNTVSSPGRAGARGGGAHVGKRGGWLSGVHAAELLGTAHRELIDRSGRAGHRRRRVPGRRHHPHGLARRRPAEPNTGTTTIDAQCGSAQQATHLIAAGAIAAGWSRCAGRRRGRTGGGGVLGRQGGSRGSGHAARPVLAARPGSAGSAELAARPGRASRADRPGPAARQDLAAPQGLATRRNRPGPAVRQNLAAQRDRPGPAARQNRGAASLQKAAAAWAAGRFDRELVPVRAPDPVTGESRSVIRDQGLRVATVDGLAALNPVLPDGLHTAGTSSQISDGAAALLLMDATLPRPAPPRAHPGPGPDRRRTVLPPRWPHPGHRTRSGPGRHHRRRPGPVRSQRSVRLSRPFLPAHPPPGPSRVNVNGGASALGRPVGSTGARLLTTAQQELERRDRAHHHVRRRRHVDGRERRTYLKPGADRLTLKR